MRVHCSLRFTPSLNSNLTLSKREKKGLTGRMNDDEKRNKQAISMQDSIASTQCYDTDEMKTKKSSGPSSAKLYAKHSRFQKRRIKRNSIETSSVSLGIHVGKIKNKNHNQLNKNQLNLNITRIKEYNKSDSPLFRSRIKEG